MSTPSLPPQPTDDREILEWARATADFLRSITPRTGADVLVHRTSGGTRYSIRRKPRGKGELDPYRNPFDVFVTPDGGIGVQPGMINNEEPDTIGGASDWTYTAGAGEVWLKVVVTTGQVVTTRELYKGSDVPAIPTPGSGDTELTSYLHLATITVDGEETTIEQHYNGSRWCAVVVTGVACSSGGLEISRTLTW